MKSLSTSPGVTARLADYPFESHWASVPDGKKRRAALIHALSLRDFVFVLHDWGGIIGLRIVAEYSDRVAGLAISNTDLPERDPSEPPPAGYRAPYPDPALTIGSRAFTQQLPTRPDNPMLADGGHFLQADIPDAYNRALLAWLTTNVGR